MTSAANWENFFRSSLRAVQFASCSQLLRVSPLETFQLQILSYDADNRWHDLGMPIFRDISRTVLWVWDWSSASWVRTISFTCMVNVFNRAGTSRSVDALTSVHCARVSELLEQSVNATCPPSFVRKFCPQLSRIISLFNWYNFLLESYLCHWKPCLQTM